VVINLILSYVRKLCYKIGYTYIHILLSYKYNTNITTKGVQISKRNKVQCLIYILSLLLLIKFDKIL